jgi:hypothetical protein
VLLVGPGQERWIDLHRHVAPADVDWALATVLVACSGSIDDAAAHLNVRPEYLERFARRGRVQRAFALRGIYPERGGAEKPGLPPYSPPTDAAAARAVALYRNPAPGQWRGAWRFEGLLVNPNSRQAALDVVEAVAARAGTAEAVAEQFGVSHETLRKWRRAWPALDAIVALAGAARVERVKRRAFTLEEAIDCIEPFLPATSGELDRALRYATEYGTIPRFRRPLRSRRLAPYVGRADATGRIIMRRTVNEPTARNTFEWSIARAHAEATGRCPC